MLEKKTVRFGDFATTLRDWRTSGVVLSLPRIAADTGRSSATVQRWFTGHMDPHLSDLVVMERLKPGLLAWLLRLAKPTKGGRRA